MEAFQVLEAGAVYVYPLPRLLLVLHPSERELYRVLLIGRRRLSGRAWGFVENAAHAPSDLARELAGLSPSESGRYGFALHEGHVHLILETTARRTFVVLAKDPAARLAPRRDPRQPELPLGLPTRARTWTALRSPLQLDRRGAEFVLVETSVDPGLEVPAPPRRPGVAYGAPPPLVVSWRP